jgi:hypothetical protein
MRAAARPFRVPVLVVPLLVLASCSGPTRFLDPEADLPYYQKVAIVPFTSLAQDRAGGAKVTDVFFAELLQSHPAEVVDPGQFAAAMQKVRGGTPPESPWSTEDLARLGETTGAQGFYFGTVRDYEMVRAGQDSYPHVSLEARFVDAATGRVVWSASRTKRGGPGVPIIGWLFSALGGGETHTLGELTADVCREMLETLPEAK